MAEMEGAESDDPAERAQSGKVVTWVLWGISGLCFLLFCREYYKDSYRLSMNSLLVLAGAIVLLILPKLSEFEFLGIKGKFRKLKDIVAKEVKQNQAERDFAKKAEEEPPKVPEVKTAQQAQAEDELRQFALSFPVRFLNFLAFLCEKGRPATAGEIASEGNYSGIDPAIFTKLFEYAQVSKLIEREHRGYAATQLAKELISATKFFYRKPRRSVFSSDENWAWRQFEKHYD